MGPENADLGSEKGSSEKKGAKRAQKMGLENRVSRILNEWGLENRRVGKLGSGVVLMMQRNESASMT